MFKIFFLKYYLFEHNISLVTTFVGSWSIKTESMALSSFSSAAALIS